MVSDPYCGVQHAFSREIWCTLVQHLHGLLCNMRVWKTFSGAFGFLFWWTWCLNVVFGTLSWETNGLFSTHTVTHTHTQSRTNTHIHAHSHTHTWISDITVTRKHTHTNTHIHFHNIMYAIVPHMYAVVPQWKKGQNSAPYICKLDPSSAHMW